MVMKNEESPAQEKFRWADCLLTNEEIHPPRVFQLTVFSEGIRPSLEIKNKEAFLDNLSKRINSSVWHPKKAVYIKKGF